MTFAEKDKLIENVLIWLAFAVVIALNLALYVGGTLLLVGIWTGRIFGG